MTEAPPARVQEAALVQYVFLALRLKDEAGRVQRLEDECLSLLRQAEQHLHDWVGAPLAGAARPGGGAPQWLYAPDGQWAGYAYAPPQINDTLAVQLVYARRGAGGAAVWQDLRRALWPPGDAVRVRAHFLGQTLCFGGRVSGEAEARRQAEAALPPARPEQPLPLRAACLPFGGWLFDRPGLPDALALFYPDRDEVEALASGFFNDVLPSLALYAHKVAHQYDRGYKSSLRPELERTEAALAEALLAARPPDEDLGRLEAQLNRVAAAYGSFAAALGRFERLQQSVAVNAANFAEVFARHALPEAGPLAARRAVVARAVEQLQADENFYRAIIHEAEVTLQALRVQAEIKRGQIEEEENRLAQKAGRQADLRNTLLALVAAVLAVGEIIGEEAAGAFIRWLWPLLAWAPPDPLPAGLVFWVKAALVLVVGLGVGALVVLGLRVAQGARRGRAP